jgi:hypothetical protein
MHKIHKIKYRDPADVARSHGLAFYLTVAGCCAAAGAAMLYLCSRAPEIEGGMSKHRNVA